MREEERKRLPALRQAGMLERGELIKAGGDENGALWPTASFLLLLPQRRPESVDENRPL